MTVYFFDESLHKFNEVWLGAPGGHIDLPMAAFGLDRQKMFRVPARLYS